MSKPGRVPFETTLRVRDTCLCLHTHQAARALARRFDSALRPLRLTNGQFSLLMALNRPEPPSMGPVAELLGLDRTTLTAALKPLERRGLVGVLTDPADRRGRRLLLTAAGHALLLQALPVWERTHREVEELISGPGPDVVLSGLRALRSGRVQGATERGLIAEIKNDSADSDGPAGSGLA